MFTFKFQEVSDKEYGSDLKPGHWCYPVHPCGESVTKQAHVFICCPVCKTTSRISKKKGKKGHTVDSEGKVHPSLVCPFECIFHDYGQLEGWK